MPFYQQRGRIPEKRHIQFRDKKGQLYWEELISREGFGYVYSNVYHLHPPTAVDGIGDFIPQSLDPIKNTHTPRHIRTRSLEARGNIISSRIPLFYNDDVIISKGIAGQSSDLLYRNGHYDECLFIHSGKGTFKSNFGVLDVKPGDYLVIPRGVIWSMEILDAIEFLVTETPGAIETPTRYRNRLGQLMEHSPFSERDIRTPHFVEPVSKGSSEVMVRLTKGYQFYNYQHHPFDIIGWDGYFYPWIFNIHDFMPITGKVHQPPPVHQTFQARGVVICSFVSRLYDYHPDAIPAPYAHSNVDSDEILYYVQGNFMSRRGIEAGSITFHPMGLPHGPQPGKIEESLGAEKTNELAVMIDTFNPLSMTHHCQDIDEADYPISWKEPS